MENKGLYINDLPQSGEVTFLAVVIEKELRPKRNGGSFLSLRLAAGEDPGWVAKMLGHTKISQTQKYAKVSILKIQRETNALYELLGK